MEAGLVYGEGLGSSLMIFVVFVVVVAVGWVVSRFTE